MGGVSKAMSKGFKSFRKFSGGQLAQRALIGDKNYDKLHFISTSSIRGQEKLEAAEKAGKSAEAAAEQMRQKQAVALAELDEEENRRIKKLLTTRSARAYRGSPMFRGRASNTAGGAARTAAGGSSSSAAAPTHRSAGTRGGLARAGYRSLLP